MDMRKKKPKWADSRGEDSGNGTDWKSDAGSISGAKFIHTPICDNEDDDEMELNQYVELFDSHLKMVYAILSPYKLSTHAFYHG